MREKSDISPRGLAVGVAIIVVGIAASFGAAALITARVAAPPTGASRGEPPAIAGAVLQTAPPLDLQSYVREKNALLDSHGAIKGDPKHVRIPIEQAMRILAERKSR